MASFLEGVLKKIKQNTLDKTDLDEKIGAGINSFFKPQQQPVQNVSKPVKAPSNQINFKSAMQGVADRLKLLQPPIQKAVSVLGQQPIINNPTPFKLPFNPPRIADVVKDIVIPTVQAIPRSGFEGAQTIEKDERVYNPGDIPGGKILFGNEPLRNFNDPNRPSGKLLSDLNAPEPVKKIGTPALALVGAVLSDIPFVGGGSKVAGQQAIKIAKTAGTVDDFAKTLKAAKPSVRAFVTNVLKDSKNPINTMEDFFASARKGAPTVKDIIPAKNLVAQNIHYEGGWKRVIADKATGKPLVDIGTSPAWEADIMKNGLDKTLVHYPENLPGAVSKTLVDQGQAIKTPTIKPIVAKTPEEVPSVNYLYQNADKLKADYRARFGNVVNPDNAKELFRPAGYNPEVNPLSSAHVHEASSELSKMIYRDLLAENKGLKNNVVLFTAGGSGVGKTSAIKQLLDLNEYPIIVDSNLSNFESAVKKIDEALKSGYKVEIKYVDRNPVLAWNEGVLVRTARGERHVPLDNHIALHQNAPEAIQKLNQKYGNKIDIKIIDNNGLPEEAKYVPIENLAKKVYNKDELRRTLYDETNKAIQQGKITSDRIPEIQKGSEFPGSLEKGSIPGNTTESSAKRVEDILAKKPGAPGAKPSGKTVDQVFNTSKFNLDSKQEETLKKLQETLNLGSRKTRTFENIEELAGDLGTNPVKIIKDIQTGRITDSEVVALGNIINSSTKRIETLSKQLKLHPNDIDLIRKLNTEETLLNKAIKKRIRGGTEAGRSVVAFKILANKTMEPAYWLSKAKKQIGSDKELPAEVVTAITKLIDSNDRIGLANFISKLGESGGLEKAIGLWKAGLLTGVKTHLANIMSNTTMAGLETAKDIPATAFDAIRAGMTGGQRTKAVSLDSVFGQVKAIPAGFKKAKEIVKEGVSADDLLKADIRKPLRFGKTKGGKIAQAYTDIVFRTLGAEDKVFKEMAFARSLAEQAKVAKINGKLTTKQMKDLILNPTKEMLQEATKQSEISTFTNENAVADMFKRAKAAGEVGAAVLDIMAPFTKTPTNVAGMMYKYSPLGFPTTLVSKIAKGSKVTSKDIADSFGRSFTGTGIMVLGYELAKAGKLTGNAPTAIAQKNEKNLEGETPMSIFINGKWRSITRISPIGNLLVLGAEAFNNGLDPVGLLASGAKNLTDQTFLKGVSGALTAVNDPARGAEKYFNSLISSNVPTLLSDIAKGTDEFVRSPEGIIENVKQRIPAIREEVPVRIDQLGNPTKNEAGLLGTLFDPFNSRTPSNDPIVKEFKRVGYNLNYVGETIGKVSLNRDQQREYQKLAGQYIQQILPDVISSEVYQTSDIDTQKDIIDKAVKNAKTQARNQIKDKLDEIGASGGNVAEAAEEDKTPDAVQPKVVGKTEYEKSSDAPKGLLETVILYGNSTFTDPGTTIKALINRQPIRKITGDAVILERKKGLSQDDDPNTERDHKIALSLGGSNDDSNLIYISKAENRAKGVVDTYLFNLLKEGQIDKKEAQKRDLNWKDEIDNLPKKTQEKLLLSLSEDIEATSSATGLNKVYKIVNKETGSLKTIDLSKPIKELELTGNAALDKKLKSEHTSALTKRSNDIVALYKDGQLTAEEAEQLLTGVAASKASSGKSGSGTASSKKMKAAYKKILTARSNLTNTLSKKSSLTVLDKTNPFKKTSSANTKSIEDILRQKRKLVPISQLPK